MTVRQLSFAALALATLAGPPAAEAQQPAKVPRIGYLSSSSPTDLAHLLV